MKNILITGVNGLLGFELVKILSETHQVFGISRTEPDFTHDNFTHLKIDFESDWPLKELPEKIDFIFHFAQSDDFRDFPEKGQQIFKVNTLSTVKLLDYGLNAGCKKFIYASSGGVYGNSDIGFNEDAPVSAKGDLGFYLSTKYCSEVLVENYNSFFDVEILRFFFVYGERQKRSMLIPRIVDSIKEGRPITLQGTEGVRVNPIYVGDAVKSIIKVMDLKGSHKINIGGAEILSLKNIGDLIGSITGCTPIYKYEDKEPKNLISDIAKMKKLLLEPQTKFAEGIKKII